MLLVKEDVFTKYQLFSDLFKYPNSRLHDTVDNCLERLNEDYPEAKELFQKFATWVEETPQYEIEEVFTKTFHIQAICYLDLGYVIFGEDYKRGEFLVNMKSEQLKAQNDCGEELPDNLANVLSLIPKLTDSSFRNELCVRIIIPAIKKMLKEFESARMDLKVKVLQKKHKAILLQNQRNGNIYRYVLEMLLSVLEKDFEGIKYDEPSSVSTNYGFEAATCNSCSFVSDKSFKTKKS